MRVNQAKGLLMMKALVASMVLTVALSGVLAGCGPSGPPKPPVETLFNLDRLVTAGMTTAQVDALMTPALRATVKTYGVLKAEPKADGSWLLKGKEGGFKPGEVVPFQVYYVAPQKGDPTSYMGIYFKDGLVIGKSLYDVSVAGMVENLLKGEKVIQGLEKLGP